MEAVVDCWLSVSFKTLMLRSKQSSLGQSSVLTSPVNTSLQELPHKLVGSIVFSGLSHWSFAFYPVVPAIALLLLSLDSFCLHSLIARVPCVVAIEVYLPWSCPSQLVP
ncbi:hypothetical protein Tco_0542288 [Tanacetum coccineum]